MASSLEVCQWLQGQCSYESHASRCTSRAFQRSSALMAQRSAVKSRCPKLHEERFQSEQSSDCARNSLTQASAHCQTEGRLRVSAPWGDLGVSFLGTVQVVFQGNPLEDRRVQALGTPGPGRSHGAATLQNRVGSMQPGFPSNRVLDGWKGFEVFETLIKEIEIPM